MTEEIYTALDRFCQYVREEGKVLYFSRDAGSKAGGSIMINVYVLLLPLLLERKLKGNLYYCQFRFYEW